MGNMNECFAQLILSNALNYYSSMNLHVLSLKKLVMITTSSKILVKYVFRMHCVTTAEEMVIVNRFKSSGIS